MLAKFVADSDEDGGIRLADIAAGDLGPHGGLVEAGESTISTLFSSSGEG